MKAKILSLVILMMVTSACSTKLQVPPAKIDPPPVALVTPCLPPRDLPSEATASDLAAWAVDWIGSYGCAESKRKALVESWPK